MTALPVSIVAALLLVALIGSFLFSGSETGLITMDPLRVRFLADEGRRSARFAARLLSHREQSLIAVLIGNNLALVLATVAMVTLLERFLLSLAWPSERAQHTAQVLTPILLTPIILMGCEILPKSIFRVRPIRMTAVAVPILLPFRWAVTPIAFVLVRGSRALAGWLQGEPVEHPPLVTREEMLRRFTQGVEGGAIEADEREMIKGIIHFAHRTAGEIMVPRPKVSMARQTATCGDLYDLVTEEGHSRIPIYADRVDSVVGFVHIRDLLGGMYEEQASIQPIIRPVLHVPESMRLDDLLREMRVRQRSVAIVVNEHGGTAGLVTIEDLIEEIVGEIRDEYDRDEQPDFRRLPDGSILVAGWMSLTDVEDDLGIRLPPSHAPVETVGGYLVQLQGRIPRVGEIVVVGDWQFHIVAATSRTVQRVRIRRIAPTEEARL